MLKILPWYPNSIKEPWYYINTCFQWRKRRIVLNIWSHIHKMNALPTLLLLLAYLRAIIGKDVVENLTASGTLLTTFHFICILRTGPISYSVWSLVSLSSCVMEQSSLLGLLISYEKRECCEYGTRTLHFLHNLRKGPIS
jgi:hypothetical protein